MISLTPSTLHFFSVWQNYYLLLSHVMYCNYGLVVFPSIWLFIYLFIWNEWLLPFFHMLCSMYLSLTVFPACCNRAIIVISNFCILCNTTKCVSSFPAPPAPGPKPPSCATVGWLLSVHCPAVILGSPLCFTGLFFSSLHFPQDF